MVQTELNEPAVTRVFSNVHFYLAVICFLTVRPDFGVEAKENEVPVERVKIVFGMGGRVYASDRRVESQGNCMEDIGV